MKINFDEDDIVLVAKSLAKSRKIECDFEKPFSAASIESEIYGEACRVIAAFRDAQ